jgi:hypothetical protein
MAEIVNLNRVRKAKARDEQAKTADVNRVKFGRNKAEKQLDKLEAERSEKSFDGHKRET